MSSPERTSSGIEFFGPHPSEGTDSSIDLPRPASKDNPNTADIIFPFGSEGNYFAREEYQAVTALYMYGMNPTPLVSSTIDNILDHSGLGDGKGFKEREKKPWDSAKLWESIGYSLLEENPKEHWMRLSKKWYEEVNEHDIYFSAQAARLYSEWYEAMGRNWRRQDPKGWRILDKIDEPSSK
ncbi:hypothetical protein MMC28_002891 [Mycoblastus sanguinarius]|nr:hypothetical protein [Mycoblastus sanguinarius]